MITRRELLKMITVTPLGCAIAAQTVNATPTVNSSGQAYHLLIHIVRNGKKIVTIDGVPVDVEHDGTIRNENFEMYIHRADGDFIMAFPCD